jgi:hypothetical protein
MSEDKKTLPAVRQEVVPLSGGWFMVRHVSKEMCRIMWRVMDENQRGEVYALYGNDEKKALDGMWEECRTSDHQAAFFDGTTPVCIMWAAPTHVTGVGTLRVMGCFCNSEYARNRTLAFVKKTPECRDAFELDEPKEATELYVFIASGYKQSNKWAVMFGGMTKAFDAHFNEHPFVCYKREIGG